MKNFISKLTLGLLFISYLGLGGLLLTGHPGFAIRMSAYVYLLTFLAIFVFVIWDRR